MALKSISGQAKFYPSKELPLGKTFKGHLVGYYNGGQYPEITNLKIKALSDLPTIKNKKGEDVSVKVGEVFTLNVHGTLKYFKENCAQNGVDPLGCYIEITQVPSKKNKRNQTVAQFIVNVDDENKVEVVAELPPDEELNF